MKKSLLKTILATLALAFLFAACSNPSSPDSKPSKPSKPDPKPAKANEIPLTLEALEDNTTITLSETNLVTNLKYSIDGAEPVAVSSSEPVEISLSKDSCISFYGQGVITDSDNLRINCSADCYVYGNVMSLLYSDFKDATEIRQDYAFRKLFFNNEHIKNSTQKELLLPATSLTQGCYVYMFGGCSSLTAAPALPATSLAKECYESMFYSCSSLTAAPELPATNLAEACYSGMFYDCTSLTTAPALPATSLEDNCYEGMFNCCASLATAPALPATSLEDYCYSYMFYGCRSLTKAPALPATSLAGYCYNAMFLGCTSLKTAPELPATSLAGYCYNAMFYDCTSLETAPELPAASLADLCYSYMFSGCTSLETAPALPATSLADCCYEGMFHGCKSLETAPALPATSLEDYCYYGMFSGCIKLNYVKCLATDISAKGCLTDWLYGVAATGTFVKFPSATWATAGSNGIPSGWTVKNDIDSIPANEIPLTLEALEDNTTITLSQTNLVTNLKISIDGEAQIDVSSSDPVEIPLSKGSCISFYAQGTSSSAFGGKFFINCSADCYVYGNVMSLLSSDFKNATEITQTYAFMGLFYNNTHIKNSPQKELLLPATSLTEGCYQEMFTGCTSLETAPDLPAENLAAWCYYQMFYGCTSLAKVSALPAKSLTEGCYSSMFYGCTSLTAAPVLPAETLADFCYHSMFMRCTSLEAAPSLPATSLAENCYQDMFHGCTSLTQAPDLPATSLEESCYCDMFSGCSSLNYVKCLATDISASDCVYRWLDGVAATGTFVKSPSASWAVAGQKGIPSGWKVIDAN